MRQPLILKYLLLMLDVAPVYKAKLQLTPALISVMIVVVRLAPEYLHRNTCSLVCFRRYSRLLISVSQQRVFHAFTVLTNLPGGAAGTSYLEPLGGCDTYGMRYTAVTGELYV